ncbi:MAG TPA: ATP-binding protein [Candidatus Angelobacter sp.]|jgi:CheY-like chemotaxis protein
MPNLSSHQQLEELERKLEQQSGELRDAKKELEDFTYSVSHDLRAPLRHISGYSQIILDDYGKALDPQCLQYMENIQSATQKLGVMLDGLLKLSHLGQQELQRQDVDLDRLVHGIVQGLVVSGRQIEWKIGRLPKASCDGAMIKQVFINLLENAVKFTRSQSQAVVEVDAIERNGGTTFFVRDNGMGFDMKYADKLFVVFQRLHAQREIEGGGTGLAITRRIIHQHGGRIWAESALDQGATFYFTLHETAVATPQSRGSGQHLLYVDDEESLVLLATRSLERLGYRVTGYTDPSRALQAFSENPRQFAAVITDLSMPGLSGSELTRHLIEIRPDIPVVMTSGHIRPEDELEARRIGVRDFILKPDTIEELAKSLHRVFNSVTIQSS